MDAAVALQRKKTIKFLCIVDFSLSKQGIFFITLRQQRTVRRQVLPFFFFYRPQNKYDAEICQLNMDTGADRIRSDKGGAFLYVGKIERRTAQNKTHFYSARCFAR